VFGSTGFIFQIFFLVNVVGTAVMGLMIADHIFFVKSESKSRMGEGGEGVVLLPVIFPREGKLWNFGVTHQTQK